jgi:hypothetical protein
MDARQWFLSHLPAALVVRPAEWFLAILCFLSGLAIVIGVSHPEAAAKLLWQPVYYIWGSSLLVGSVALMSGLSSIKWARGTDMYVIHRIPAYRLGLRLLGWTSAAYAVALGVVGHWNAALAISLTLTFSATCLIRLLTLGRGI